MPLCARQLEEALLIAKKKLSSPRYDEGRPLFESDGMAVRVLVLGVVSRYCSCAILDGEQTESLAEFTMANCRTPGTFSPRCSQGL